MKVINFKIGKYKNECGILSNNLAIVYLIPQSKQLPLIVSDGIEVELCNLIIRMNNETNKEIYI